MNNTQIFEDFDFPHVNPYEFKESIKFLLGVGDYTPVLALGKAGIGKTVSTFEVAQELGIGYKELRLVYMSEVDMRGVPRIENNRTVYAPAADFPDPEVDGEVGLLVLDEITSAKSGVRASAYQLMDSKRALGSYKLPDKWMVVALGNGPDDGGVFEGMESAFISRCRGFRVEVDTECWLNWGMHNEINPLVMAYIRFEPDKLHVFNPDETKAFPCPRTWEKVSTVLNHLDSLGQDYKPNKLQLLAAINASVGGEVGRRFLAFYEFKGSNFVDINGIFDGTQNPKNMKNAELEVTHITVQNMLGVAKKRITGTTDEDVMALANACKWIIGLSEIELDLTVSSMRGLVANIANVPKIILSNSFDKICPEFLTFCKENEIVLS
jgi:hypothetical protein